VHDSSRNERQFNNRKEPSEINFIIGSTESMNLSSKAGENSRNGIISSQKGSAMTTYNLFIYFISMFSSVYFKESINPDQATNIACLIQKQSRYTEHLKSKYTVCMLRYLKH
jgi:hypothetical protein